MCGYNLLTHEHYDHIFGVNDFKCVTHAPVLCNKTCTKRIEDARNNMDRLFEAYCELQTWMEFDYIPISDENYTCQADKIFEDEMIFDWRGNIFRLFEMPGYSLGSIVILLDNQLFLEDSLIEGKEVELRFLGGSKANWEKIGKKRLALIPDGIQAHPGHFKEFICVK